MNIKTIINEEIEKINSTFIYHGICKGVALSEWDVLNEDISENVDDVWYHGTPDVRDLEKTGGFTDRAISVEYIENIEGYKQIMNDLVAARKRGDDSYFNLLDKVSDFKKQYRFKKPIFLTDNYNVAKTYADPKRALDYQGAEEKVLKVIVSPNKLVTINAYGDKFRFIDVNKAKQGFINAGVNENDVNKVFQMFNYVDGDSGVKTDTLAAIGSYLKFDSVDVKGVYDSYHCGNVQSTVKMVLNPNIISIIK